MSEDRTNKDPLLGGLDGMRADRHGKAHRRTSTHG